jgi:1-acyl-sn-glycerol-3-phosphate acyltransferase
LFQIPIFGHAMAAARALPIARSKLSEVMKVYEQATGRFANGECFILSPEGTRQKEERLGPFKSGPFLFAISAQVPVVPIAIQGASKIQPKGVLLPNSQKWKSLIKVSIGKPILTVGMTADSKKDLQDQVQNALCQMGLS